MKKLSLKNLNFGVNDPLKREELKTIFGGYSGGGGGGGGTPSACSADCGNGITVECSGTYKCVATNGVGCNADDGDDKKNCPIA